MFIFFLLSLSLTLVSFESAFHYVQNHEQFDLLWHKLFDPNNVVRSIFIHKRRYFSSFLLNTLDLIIGMAQCCQLLEKWIPFCAQSHRNWVTIFEYLKYRENWFRLKMFQFDCVAILICLFYFFSAWWCMEKLFVWILIFHVLATATKLTITDVIIIAIEKLSIIFKWISFDAVWFAFECFVCTVCTVILSPIFHHYSSGWCCIRKRLRGAV